MRSVGIYQFLFTLETSGFAIVMQGLYAENNVLIVMQAHEERALTKAVHCSFSQFATASVLCSNGSNQAYRQYTCVYPTHQSSCLQLHMW